TKVVLLSLSASPDCYPHLMIVRMGLWKTKTVLLTSGMNDGLEDEHTAIPELKRSKPSLA
ncbi:MAG: hypothetical protein ACK5M4_06445, partial [Pseudorhodobacter sp.]